jgi:hypothetical protein
VLSIPLPEVLRIMVAARGDAGGIPRLIVGGAHPTRLDLVELLDRLNETQIVELLALVSLGSGDFTAAQWAEALAEARAHPEPATYLATLPMLGDYLLEGLVELDYPPEDLAGHSD